MYGVQTEIAWEIYLHLHFGIDNRDLGLHEVHQLQPLIMKDPD